MSGHGDIEKELPVDFMASYPRRFRFLPPRREILHETNVGLPGSIAVPAGLKSPGRLVWVNERQLRVSFKVAVGMEGYDPPIYVGINHPIYHHPEPLERDYRTASRELNLQHRLWLEETDGFLRLYLYLELSPVTFRLADDRSKCEASRDGYPLEWWHQSSGNSLEDWQKAVQNRWDPLRESHLSILSA